MSKGMKTKIFRVTSSSTSLRGTIPQSVVDSLKLSHGDTLKWSIEVRDSKIIAMIEKVEKM